MLGVHRIVETHAAYRGSEVALVGAGRVLTYRELNQRANALARYLIDQGLRRGARAVVKMDRGPELAVALLAVLKAGAAYTWLDLDEDGMWPDGISLVRDIDGGAPGARRRRRARRGRGVVASGAEPADSHAGARHRVRDAATQRAAGCPRAARHDRRIAVSPAAGNPPLVADPGALDLWIPLMAGTAVILTAAPTAAAA